MTKNLDYIELICRIVPYSDEYSEILIAYLNDVGFESFMQTETVLNAYIAERNCSEATLKNLQHNFHEFKVTYIPHSVKDQNWNEVWTRNYFEPIVFGKELVVRASFHSDYPKTEMEIVIDPKTAFGTGNHGTTYMLMEEILKMDMKGKSVLDMGTGTGILAILSKMKGSAYTLAVDNDPKAVINTSENIEVNNTYGIQVEEGDITLLKEERFDIIYENIWKNIVINDIPNLFQHLKPGGTLLVSGFYYEEYEEVKSAGEMAGLTFICAKENNAWAMLKFLKS